MSKNICYLYFFFGSKAKCLKRSKMEVIKLSDPGNTTKKIGQSESVPQNPDFRM